LLAAESRWLTAFHQESEVRMKKVELLAPAGSFEKLEVAVHYGADAVYIAGKDFSLRNFSGNFSEEELESAVDFAHARGVKVYVACNIFSRNHEQSAISDYLDRLGTMGPDAVIIADPGIVLEAAARIPDIPIHLSTQSNTTNYRSVRFWEKMGVSRVNMARELSLEEIREIADQSSVEIEAFVHGAMCISYSGRCLLSNYMTGRDGNRGECCHPCRWRYAVVEETRPGQYFPAEADGRGTYLFSSRDLCMIGHLPDLVGAGIDSLKIEGRMKGINYVASVVKTYREAIDRYYEDPPAFRLDGDWLRELDGISHRPYGTGFYFGRPDPPPPADIREKPETLQRFIGKVISGEAGGQTCLDVRNKFFRGEPVEVLTRKGPAREDRILGLFDGAGAPLEFARPNTSVNIVLEGVYEENDLIRRPGPAG
jgi:putative protease